MPPVLSTSYRYARANKIGIGDSGEEAFFRVAEEGLVLYDPAKVNWQAYKVGHTVTGKSEGLLQRVENLGNLPFSGLSRS